MCWHIVSTAPTYCFAPLFQKRKPSGLSAKNALFLFAKLFLLGLFSQKKKRYKGKLTFDTKTF